MSEGDVSLIRDEDVLRRMWQQTEDFSRKKEIRTHMYKLREERLRNLYSPEPGAEVKGCEFSSTQGHVKSFADQSFQSMKSKEVRDAGSPPKEFTYRGQDLKELSNAGWNVESENRTTDDGRTHVKSIHANIEGQYDVDGGRGQFAAVDHNKQAITEYDDGNTSLKRNENVSNTAAHEQVVRKTDDGTQFSSTTSSSTSTSKFEQISSKHESVPYTNDNYDLSSEKCYDTNRNENLTSNRLTKTTEYEQNLRNDFDNGDVISRKVEYPDENTKVIVETRRLPDGTRVTSTRREFRAPAVQTSRSEQHSHQTKTESKSSSYAATQQRSHINESSSKTIRETIDNSKQDIVDSQKTIDDFEFKRHHDFDHSHNKVVEHDTRNKINDSKRDTTIYDTHVDDNTRREVFTTHDDENTKRSDISEVQSTKNVEERVHNITRENVIVERKTSSDQYQSTYQSDYSQRKISNEWSPAHQAWASTLRSDTPTRPSTRASSPGSKTFKSSTSSLRSSVSPDKSQRKPSSRGGSPSKIDRHSPSTTVTEKYSSNYSTNTVTEKTNRYVSPDEKMQDNYRPRSSASPEKRHYPTRGPSSSPDRKFRDYKPDHSRPKSPIKRNENTFPRTNISPDRKTQDNYRPRSSASPEKPHYPARGPSSSPDRKFRDFEPNDFRSKSPVKPNDYTSQRSNLSPDRKIKTSRTSPSPSDDMYPRSPSPKRQFPDAKERKPYHDTDVLVKDNKVDMFPSSPTKSKPSEPFESKRNLSPSPDRKIKQKPSSPTKSVSEPIQKLPKESSPSTKISKETRNENDNMPGYMRPTAASKSTPTDDSYHLPNKSEPSSKISKYRTPESPERKIYETSINTVKEDHYKFIDEETKMYAKKTSEVQIKTDSKDINESKQSLKERSPSPTKYLQKSPHSTPRSSPAKDVPNDALLSNDKPHRPSYSPTRNKSSKNDFVSTSTVETNKTTIVSTGNETLPQNLKSPSPNKSVSLTRHVTNKDEPISDNPKKLAETPTQDTPNRKSPDRVHSTPRQKSPEKKDKSFPHGRSPSPTKDTKLTINNQEIATSYEETVDTEENSRYTKTTKTDNYREDTRKESNDTVVIDKDFKNPNNQQREHSPSKNYNNKPVKNDKPEVTQDSSPNAPKSNRAPSHTSIEKSPRNSASPTKSPVRDNKYKLASDFINIEKTTEETNKNTLTRPRQLITPSTSPTRKPKLAEYAPSSGQSSPTTSVSGFEYFSHRPDKHIVTDLDEQCYTENTTDFINYEKTTDIKSPLSSKIPRRSPSPERRPIKESLPRKSSLKKPSNQISPTEKPPSNFVVSPNLENKEFIDHKVTIKDCPNKEKDKPVKPKPPFERRETYEERCRKILGMIETDSNETETVSKETTKFVQNPDSDFRSPSVSPCHSPDPDDHLVPKDTVEKTSKITKEDARLVSESIFDTKTTVSLDNISVIRKTNKNPSRETSPTKLQDITKYPSKVDKFENETESNLKTQTPDKPCYDVKPNRSHVSPVKDVPEKVLQSTDRKPEKLVGNEKLDKFPKTKKDDRIRPTSPEKRPMKSSVASTEYEQKDSVENFRQEIIKTVEVADVTDNVKPRSSVSPSRQVPKKSTSPTRSTKDNETTTISSKKINDYSTEFITSEKEKEVLDRVQKSLRKLSPDRKEKSPIQEGNVPKATTTTLRDLEIISQTDDTEDYLTETVAQITNKKVFDEEITLSEKQKVEKSKDQKISSKPPSRNVSPTKKVTNTSPVPPRSISPKKPLSPTERPLSPQVPKASGIKPREQISSPLRKPSPTSSPTKPDKSITSDVKKITSTNKQINTTKISGNKFPNNKVSPTTVHKIEQEPKRTPINKGIKDNVKKELDSKITRTASDTTLKSKKTLAQKIRSKPEIQVNDVTTGKINKQTTTTTKLLKTSLKDHQTKLPTSKPKSATALNTSTDDDDVIIDVQQAKSSRENSPDRICPTPVGNSEDIGTPRFPDEVKEPDDEYRKRHYQAIHETESIVDDIVEISEDDELFVKRTNVEYLNEEDDSLLSVNSKVSKFMTKIEDVSKPKDTTAKFKETERKVHSDFIDENLKSDDCLLSVSEKVNKFATRPMNRKDNRSPTRNIVEEFDKNTTYQDDYTKLSVNDKAHLFIETAENVKTAKTKPAQKIDRPDFYDIDDELKTDDCLLSVSDKVNKFVKTAEQFLSDTQEIEEKEKKIKEQHDKIMRKIVENVDVTLSSTKTDNRTDDAETVSKTKPNFDESVRRNSFAKETISSNAKVKDFVSPNVEINKKPSTVKITTLRSNEAVKKAKALFENIATTTPKKTNEIPHSTTSKLTDKTLTNKSPKIDSTKVQPHSLDNHNKVVDDDEKKEKCLLTNIKREPSDKMVTNKSVISHEKSPRSSPTPLRPRSPENVKAKSPSRKTIEINTDIPKKDHHESEKHEKPQDKIPGYQRPTKTSQNKEEIKTTEDTEVVSSRRGSGKFGVELRRTSTERSTVSTERRRSSVEHHQPCIEDIFDLDLLEQMLEKVVGYEQRRRIRAQIRVAKKKVEKSQVDSNTFTKTKHIVSKITKTRSPERPHKSPERQNKTTTTATITTNITTTQKATSPERHPKSLPQKCLSPERDVKSPLHRTLSSEHDEPKEDKPLFNGHVKDNIKVPEKQVRSRTPEKLTPKAPTKTKSPVRPHSPDKKSRPLSPNKTPSTKPKSNRFNEYASAYMKKVGLKESDKTVDIKSKKNPVDDVKTKKIETHHTIETKLSSSTKNTERISSKDVIEITQQNGKRSPSPSKVDRGHTVHRKISTERNVHTPERTHVSPERSNRNNERLQHSPERAVYSTEPTKHIPERTKQSPERTKQSPERGQRSPERTKHDYERPQHSPSRKHESPERVPHLDSSNPKTNNLKTRSSKETIIKTVYDIEKKIPAKQKQEEKPSWVTNRNLKKITTESRTFSSKKIEPEKPKYRQVSPSKVISKPIDVITSSYGPGPLDTDGKPLFGIKALRKGASNIQVKGTVIRQEFHSRNGGEPEGTVSVTAYSTEPEDLEKLLQAQGEKPSRLHGLAAITTTKKFGGDTGTTLYEVHNKEERAALDQFTHSDRRVIESRITSGNSSLDRREQKFTQENKVIEIDNEDRFGQEERSERIVDVQSETTESVNKHSNKMQKEKFERNVEIEKRGKEKLERKTEERKTVRQSSVKSLTEKFIKNASETSKSERHVYPKAGLILRTTTIKDSVSSDPSAHAGVMRADSEHSLGSDEEVTTTTTTEQVGDGMRTTTTTTTRSGHTRGQERSFLDSTTKVTGVQDILTRMKNADIVIEEGDSNADTEARALLNKFLGATVLMAGMQSYVAEKPSGKVVVKETVQSSGGKLNSRHIEEFDIDQCWDERVLRKLLDECTDYDQRRRLRSRIRTLMAEQEACASAVTDALAAAGETVETEEQSGERGESLLLPLLQGLLQGGGQRLLAGLGAASHDVVADVRRSLQRLRLALAPPNDHPQARALLALADRLEDALDAADRLDGCKRKPRRRSRTLRHTVGVTREELEEARRMVDRDQLLPEAAKPITPPTSSTVSTAPSIEETSTPERKQSIDDQVSYHNAVESRQKTAPQVHNASYDPTPIINRDACVVERRAPQPRKPEFFRHSIADTAHQDLSKSAAERWNSETKSSIMAIANKFDTKVQKETLAPIRRAPINRPTVTIQQKNEEDLRRSSYYRPPPPGYNFAAPPPADDMSKPLNRFNNNSKRNRMKRANTIDIGRPLGGYKIDSDTEDENTNNQAPKVPEFQPQTENDRKFLAFMQKNQDNRNTTSVGQANWSNRFGNIKNAFENREKEENNRSSSASSAKRFWQTTNDTSHSLAPRPRKFLADITPEIVKPPWVSQRRDSLRNQFPAPAQISKQFNSTPATQPQNKQIVKPFVAKPIPVNQFSHAPMSAFKPPQKILSPTSAPPNVWIPPSSSVPVSPPVDNPTIPPKILNSLSPISSTPPSRTAPNFDQSRKSLGSTVSKFENDKFESQPPVPKQYGYHQPTTPTHVRTQAQNYPIKPIPSQNELAAPELVKKLDESKNVLSPEPYVPKVDARQLQIEFYERQIREKNRREASNERRDIPVHKPPAPPAPVYTIVDYTPQNGTATFVPLQQTPDIEKAKAHKVDYLPDVVMNETNNYNYSSSPKTRVAPASPSKPPSKIPQKQQNGVAHVNHCDDGTATEHDSVVTRVMRGPVRGAATITAGVRTRGAADSLRGVLDKISTPKHEVISQIEIKKRDMARNQVRQPAPPSIRPGLSPPHAPSPPRPNQAFEYEGYPRSPAGLRSPALAASRESVFSSESPGSRDSSPGTALARSGSWHRFGEFGPKAASPRKVVARTKSMHLLAVPKLFEGGIANEELPEKKRTVEAYFTGRATSTRTSSQQTAHSPGRGRPARPSQPQSFALGRSRTMPTVSELQFLDESNADDAFEDLVSALA